MTSPTLFKAGWFSPALVATLLFFFTVPRLFAEPQAAELIKAVKSGDQKKLNALLKQGADPNGKDEIKNPILLTAALSGNERIVSTLLASGADLRATGDENWNALHYAALY